MTLAYQVEPYWAVQPELEPLMALHHAELAEDQHVMAHHVDHEAYREMDDAGGLLTVTVKRDGTLVGYALAFVRKHLHYADVMCGFVDLYYLHPLERRGLAGVKLFRFVEETLRERGAVKVYLSTKLAFDHGTILSRLGFRPSDRVFVKVLEGKPCPS